MGHWRSWLARLDGIEEVIGSNPICSTIFFRGVLAQLARALHSHCRGRRFDSAILHHKFHLLLYIDSIRN